MFLKDINTKNKIALITGAGKGIGKACAIALAEAGAHVIIISRTEKDLIEVQKIIRKHRSERLFGRIFSNFPMLAHVLSLREASRREPPYPASSHAWTIHAPA